MKTAMIKIGLATLLCTSAAFGAFAEEFTKGVVKRSTQRQRRSPSSMRT